MSWWERELGGRRVVELSAADIGDALDRLTCGPATANRYLTVFKHVLSVASREGEWITDNPASRVRARKEPRGHLRYLSDEERRRLLAACRTSDEQRLYALVVVALGTGARQGELLSLRWSDIDLVRCRATLEHTKHGERRVLALEGPVLDVLRERMAVRRIGVAQVFGSERGLATFPRNAWEQALREAGVPDFHFHDIRHTFASYMAMSGATLAELAEALGHKTLAMVKRYAHLSEAHTSGAVRRMTEKFLAQEKQEANQPAAQAHAALPTAGPRARRTGLSVLRLARYADLLFEVVFRRYLQRPLLITTNKEFAKWSEVFPNASSVVTIEADS